MSDLSKKIGSNKISRLDFLKNSAFAVGGGLVGSRMMIDSAKLKTQAGEAKNVIFLVTDGMSIGTLALADLVKQAQYGSKTHWVDLYESSDREYHRGLMDMASLNSVVTGSASAASSWGSGHRINNGAVNMTPDGRRLRTILEIFRDAGKSTGLVTTARITHATPAGFSVNVPQRGMEDEIAEQYSERNYDLLMGGGNTHFDPTIRPDSKDLYTIFRNNGYTVARNKTELNSSTGHSKLLGIFSDSHLPYTVDHKTLPELQRQVPTLAEMTRTALNRLDKNENGFILQVEGGRIDHAAHGNDAAGLVYDQIAFDDAIKVVKDYTANRDDTLVIITTDHGNANPGLSGHGSGYSDSPLMLETLFNYKHSFEWINNELNFQWSDDSVSDNVSVNRIRELVEYATSTQITDEEAEMIHQSYRGEFRTPYRNRQGAGAVKAGVMANYNGINFISTNHTADYVEIAAWGPGHELIPSFVRNTALFELMVDMAGVRSFVEG